MDWMWAVEERGGNSDFKDFGQLQSGVTNQDGKDYRLGWEENRRSLLDVLVSCFLDM